MSKDFMKGTAASSTSSTPSMTSETASQMQSAGESITNYDLQSKSYTPPPVRLTATQIDLQQGTYDSFNHDVTENTSTTKTDFKLNFEPNVLDAYDVYTYHFKLFITSLEDAAKGNVLTPNVQTIIAESGVSDLTIDKVELQGISVPSVEAGTGTQTTMKFEIVEPAGAGLLDKMFYQAMSLGIGNWLVMPCFLQLEFRGRNPETGESVSNGNPGGLSGLKWVWPIKLTNAKVNVTQVGTRYEFEAVMYDELAQSNAYFAIQHNIVLKNLTTVGDAIKELEEKINADQWEKLIDNYSIPDMYTFVVDPKIAKLPIVLPDQNKSTSRNSSYFKLSDKSANYNPGTGIDKIVDSLCGSTEYFQKKLQGSKTKNGKPDALQEEESAMKKMWRIVTDTKPTKFDMMRQDNAVSITVYIVEYDLGAVDVTAAQTGQTPDTSDATKKRFYTYAQNKIMKKKYNYIFTGLNDQIHNLDLNLNFAFAASLSRFGGIYYDSGTQEKGLVTQKNAEDEASVSKKLRETLQFINNSSATPDEKQKKIDQFLAANEAAKIDPAVKNRYAKILGYATSKDRLGTANNIVSSGGISASGELSNATIIAKSLAEPLSGKNSNGQDINLTFISDVDVNSDNAQKAYSDYQNYRKGKLRPIPMREGNQETALLNGLDPTSDAGRARTSSVFATALYSTLDASLQQLKLTIKGDPYWLFPRSVPGSEPLLPALSRMSVNDAVNTIKNAQIIYPDSVNLFGTDNFIVVRFRTPRVFDLSTSASDPNTEVSTFSGVYKVITITSRFEMGKFTQELSCLLDPVIDLQDFLKAIEESVKQPDVIQQSATTSINSGSIKNERLLAGNNLLNQAKGVSPAAIKGAVNTMTSNIPAPPTTPSQVISQTTAARSN